ncbi:hypothetical protein M0R72_06075 [Candidatus Pacearchaeota archaeon]|jgi:hypothetical protein|nr:hypothetical protein [Candidatus Pacearchaeota archaeon]
MVGEVISYKDGTITLLGNGGYSVSYIDAGGAGHTQITSLPNAIQILDANYISTGTTGVEPLTPIIYPLDTSFYQGAITYYKCGLYGQGVDGYYWVEYKDKNGNQQRVRVLTINPSISSIQRVLDDVCDTTPQPSLLQQIFPNLISAGNDVKVQANDPLQNSYAAAKAITGDNTVYYIVAAIIVLGALLFILYKLGGLD